MDSSLLIFDTHPIQYRAPVFKALSEKLNGTKVFFFNSCFDGKKWWFQEVDKIPKQDFGLSLQEGYSSTVIQTQNLTFFKKWKKLKRILLEEKPQAILIYGYYQTEHWILRLLSTQLKIPLLFVGETFDWRGSLLRKSIKKVVISSFFKSVSGFVSIGKKTWEYYRSWGIKENKITLAHYCTDPSSFLLSESEAQSARREVRNELGIGENAFVLLFVGRLFSRKRPWDLLAIHEKLKSYQSVQTVFVGNGELSESLQDEANSLKGVFFAGFKNQKEIKKYYYAADLLVVPSEFETWGLVVNEAFACALPALVTSTCGSAEDLVVPGQNGDVYNVGDIESAAQKIEKLLKQPGLSKTWGKNARKKILLEYQPEHFALSILNAFQKVTSELV